MFYTDGKLQYPVRVDSPNPLYAKMLQQAIGGVEGEIRVSMQYFFQAWGARGPKKYRDLLQRDTMHQQQWLAVLEELGGPQALPIPNSFPQGQEKGDFSYAFLSYGINGATPPEGRWSEGPSIDGRGEFHLETAQPLGEEPVLSSPADAGFAQTEQIQGGPGASPQSGNPDRPEQMGGGTMDKVKDKLRGTS